MLVYTAVDVVVAAVVVGAAVGLRQMLRVREGLVSGWTYSGCYGQDGRKEDGCEVHFVVIQRLGGN